MTHEHYLQAWQESQELAEAMQPLIGRLYRQQGIEITLYGRPLQNASTIDILKAHRVVRRHQGAPLPIQQSFPLLQAMVALNPTAAEVDLGKLAVGYWQDHQDEAGIEDYLRAKLAPALNRSAVPAPTDVVLYGFGRIGRLLADVEARKTALLRDVNERNLGYFEQEVQKLDAWADDLKLGIEQEIKEVDRQIKEVRRTAASASTLEEKLSWQKQQRELEAKRTKLRRELFNRQDAIESERNELISKAAGLAYPIRDGIPIATGIGDQDGSLGVPGDQFTSPADVSEDHRQAEAPESCHQQHGGEQQDQ